MCGITGYWGNKNATPILIETLKKLEYRGYDSCGIAVVNNKIDFIKSVGRILNLEKRLKEKFMVGNIGIAHTRWATHGKVEERNTHPHFDCKKEIAIVHNGIIENYKALKEYLERRGHEFNSETDSEVISHLFEEMLKEYSEEEAWKNTVKILEGSYAIVALYNKKLFLARKSSPLVIGISKDEYFVASDNIAISKYTNNFIFLEDNEIAIIGKEGVNVKNLEGEKVDKKIIEIKMLEEEIEKNGFETFMLKEIFEQPETLRNVIKGRINFDQKDIVFGGIDFTKIKDFKRIILFGCGSSYNAALYGKYLLDKYFDCDIELASELKYSEKKVTNKDLLIAISQSGETIDVLEALRKYKDKALSSLGIINVVSSTIAREVNAGIYLHAGREIGVAATKTYTNQILTFFLLHLYLRKRFNLIGNGEMEKFLKEVFEIPNKVRQVLEEKEKITKIAKKYLHYNNALFLGRKLNYPTALEGALKLKEISYVHAEAISAGEMKHGPIALIDDNIYSIFIVPEDSITEKVINNMQEIKARDGKIIAVTNKGEKFKEIKGLADDLIIVPKSLEELNPIINIVPLQLLAYYVAKFKGLDVDKPRNLAKTVTVE